MFKTSSSYSPMITRISSLLTQFPFRIYEIKYVRRGYSYVFVHDICAELFIFVSTLNEDTQSSQQLEEEYLLL